MALGVTATIVGGLAVAGATVYSANKQSDATNAAAGAQGAAAQAGIEEQRRQYDQMQKLLAPYVQAGTGALTGQQDLSGLNGPEAQQRAIDALQNSPQFEALAKQGENGILQNASATGGLRGGNVQGALANFRPAMLNDLINQRYSQYAGISAQGQNAAAGVGAGGQNTANQISNLYGQQGAAQAGAALGQGQQAQGYANAFSGIAGTLGGINWGGLFPSNSPAGGGGAGAGVGNPMY